MDFDPSKPFETLVDDKTQFDPNAPHEVVEAEPPVDDGPQLSADRNPSGVSNMPHPGYLESLARGFKQGVSSGFADEGTAAAESAVTPKTYKKSLAEARMNDVLAEEENPKMYKTGDLLGATAQTVGTYLAAPEVPILKGAGIIKNAIQGALQAGLRQWGENYGDKFSKEGVENVPSAMGKGAVMAGGLSLVGKGLGLGAEAMEPATEAAKSTKQAFTKIFNPREADDWPQYEAIATKNGINTNTLPESIKYGPESIVTRMSRARNESALGEDTLKSFKSSLVDVSKATEKQIENIAGGPPVSPEEAGTLIRKGYDQSIDDFFKTMDFTYRSAAKLGPGARMELTEQGRKGLNSALDSLEESATQNMAKAADNVQSSQASSVLKNIQTIRKFSVGPTDVLNAIDEAVPHLEVTPAQEGKLFTFIGRLQEAGEKNPGTASYKSTLQSIGKIIENSTPEDLSAMGQAKIDRVKDLIDATKVSKGPYEDLVDIMQNIGKVSFKNKTVMGQVPPDIKSMRSLYFSLSDALLDSVDQNLGKDIGDQIRANNTAMTGMFGDQSLIAKLINNRDLGPEKIFNGLIQRGDSSQLDVLKKILPPDVFQKIKGTYLDQMMSKNPEGIVSFRRFLNDMSDRQDQMSHLYSPQEITNMGEVLKLGDRFGRATLSSSETSSSLALQNVKDTMKSAVINNYMINKMKAKAAANSALGPEVGAGPSMLDNILTRIGNTSKYAPIIRQAADRGGQALSATSYVLQQRDPVFRKMMLDQEMSESPEEKKSNQK